MKSELKYLVADYLLEIQEPLNSEAFKRTYKLQLIRIVSFISMCQIPLHTIIQINKWLIL